MINMRSPQTPRCMVNLPEPTYALVRQIAELEERSLADAVRRSCLAYLRLRAEASYDHDDPSRLTPEQLVVADRRSA